MLSTCSPRSVRECVHEGQSQQIYSGEAIAAYGQLAGHWGWVVEALEILSINYILYQFQCVCIMICQ